MDFLIQNEFSDINMKKILKKYLSKNFFDVYILLYNIQNNDYLNESINKEKESSDTEEYNYGRWNEEEHIKFIKGCLLYGNDWKKVYIIFLIQVQHYIGTRSGIQIRSHAQKYINKLSKKYSSYKYENDDNSKDLNNIDDLSNKEMCMKICDNLNDP